MHNLFFAVGGTGSKVAQSYLHLLMAGFHNPEDEYYFFFVDPDKDNGNLHKSLELISICKAMDEKGDHQFGTAKLVYRDNGEHYWSPTDGEDGTYANLDALVVENRLKDAEKWLYNFSFDPKRRKMNFGVGFKGTTSIGALAFANAIRKGKFWEDLVNNVISTNKTNIFFCGSIFGGTGASGMPTMAKVLHSNKDIMNRRRNIKISVCPVLPFFNFDAMKDEEIQAKHEDFSFAAEAGLEIYQDYMRDRVINSIYFVGSQVATKYKKSALGAGDQTNPSTPVELVAALAAHHCFKSEQESQDGQQFFATYNSEKEFMDWEAFPVDPSESFQDRMAVHFLSCFIYYYQLHGIIKSKVNDGDDYESAWVCNLRNKAQLSALEIKKLDSFYKYSKEYLIYMYEMHDSSGVDMRLVNIDAYTKLDDDENRVLKSAEEVFSQDLTLRNVLPHTVSNLSLDGIWRRLSEFKYESASEFALSLVEAVTLYYPADKK